MNTRCRALHVATKRSSSDRSSQFGCILRIFAPPFLKMARTRSSTRHLRISTSTSTSTHALDRPIPAVLSSVIFNEPIYWDLATDPSRPAPPSHPDRVCSVSGTQRSPPPHPAPPHQPRSPDDCRKIPPKPQRSVLTRPVVARVSLQAPVLSLRRSPLAQVLLVCLAPPVHCRACSPVCVQMTFQTMIPMSLVRTLMQRSEMIGAAGRGLKPKAKFVYDHTSASGSSVQFAGALSQMSQELPHHMSQGL